MTEKEMKRSDDCVERRVSRVYLLWSKKKISNEEAIKYLSWVFGSCSDFIFNEMFIGRM